jgi:hypothetical protein
MRYCTARSAYSALNWLPVVSAAVSGFGGVGLSSAPIYAVSNALAVFQSGDSAFM